MKVVGCSLLVGLMMVSASAEELNIGTLETRELEIQSDTVQAED